MTRDRLIDAVLVTAIFIGIWGLGALLMYALVTGWLMLWRAGPILVPWHGFFTNLFIFSIILASGLWGATTRNW